MRKITLEDVTTAQQPVRLNAGDKMLLNMCRDNPGHTDVGVIASKIWIIGRAYSASLERHMRDDVDSTDAFLLAGAELQGVDIDEHLESAREQKACFRTAPTLALRIHKLVLDKLCNVTRRDPRSLCSKYLHFHKENLFPIYDQRAWVAIKQVTPHGSKVKPIQCDFTPDYGYADFAKRVYWLLGEIEGRFNVKLSLRQVDHLLLNICGELEDVSELSGGEAVVN